ncbi:hypothetical protein PPACK8108_LOCUS8205 [Phakopsora pachyrhizi]|uniref:Uncharacterized protein n=1 Tax=Phakopsora pachyrhizi TaxID=170000 RepID=A0AAV0AXQ7_PHAPC|nr:hypothetical protein PPACK8108_LOCUS8205 [Phakopsora pachyrhizi]
MSKIGKLIRTLKLHYEAQIRRNINLYQPISTSTTATRQKAIDLNSASPNKPTKKVDSEKMTKERERIGKMESMINQRPDSCLRLAFVEPGYQLFHHQPINNQNLSPWSILKLDQKEILIKYLDLLQNQAIKDLVLKKKNSNDGDDVALTPNCRIFLNSIQTNYWCFDSGKLDPSKEKDSEVLSLKEEAERAVNERLWLKLPQSCQTLVNAPVIHMAKAF